MYMLGAAAILGVGVFSGVLPYWCWGLVVVAALWPLVLLCGVAALMVVAVLGGCIFTAIAYPVVMFLNLIDSIRARRRLATRRKI